MIVIMIPLSPVWTTLPSVHCFGVLKSLFYSMIFYSIIYSLLVSFFTFCFCIYLDFFGSSFDAAQAPFWEAGSGEHGGRGNLSCGHGSAFPPVLAAWHSTGVLVSFYLLS